MQVGHDPLFGTSTNWSTYLWEERSLLNRGNWARRAGARGEARSVTYITVYKASSDAEGKVTVGGVQV
jgi:hypothetical protein